MATTLNSETFVTADGYNAPATNASVVVTEGQVLGASTVSTGLTNNFLTDSFFFPLLMVVIGVWLHKSGLLSLPAWLGKGELNSKEYIVQKKLKNKIKEAKQRETSRQM